MQTTTITDLQEAIGSTNFKFKILNRLTNEYDNSIIEVKLYTNPERIVHINEPKGKKWVELNPQVNTEYLAKFTHYPQHDRWALTPISAQNTPDEDPTDTQAIVDDMSDSQPTQSTYQTNQTDYIDLPFDHTETVTAACFVLDTSKVQPSMLISTARGVFRIKVPTNEIATRLHGKLIKFKLNKGSKRARVAVLSIIGDLSAQELSDLENYTAASRIIHGKTQPTMETPPIDPQAVTVKVGSKWSYKSLQVTIDKIESLNTDNLLWFHTQNQTSSSQYIVQTEFLEDAVPLELKWHDNIPPHGYLCYNHASGETKVIHQDTSDKRQCTPLTPEQALSLVHYPTVSHTVPVPDFNEDEIPF